jgi:hypothetical protein
MPDTSISDQCSDDTQQIVVNIPCRLALRAEKYATETGNSITGVVIEALDALLMRESRKG